MIKELDRIVGNATVKNAFRTGLTALFNAGITDALRALGRPRRLKNGENHITMASEAAWSSGWNDCLDSLLYFEEYYLTKPENEMPNVRMDFGSLTRAVASGEMTQEEADAIKLGNTPKYDPKSYTHNIPGKTAKPTTPPTK